MKRNFAHWNLKYFFNRFRLYFYEKLNPDQPWLTQTANSFLADWIKEGDVGLEWGSGRSTIWLGKRLGRLTSVESNPVWYHKVKKMLGREGMSSTEVLLKQTDESPMSDESDEGYVGVAKACEPNTLDFILIDGMCRSSCALAAVRILKPGGLLVIDNANWFLPSNSISPTSRNQKTGPYSLKWWEFAEMTSKWRCFWTSNGVTDTAIWQKPFSLS